MKKYIVLLFLFMGIMISIQKGRLVVAVGEVVDATDKTVFGSNALEANSTKNQSAQLQDILDEATKQSKRVYIPKGSYIINESINLSANYQLVGDTQGATVLINNSGGEVLLTDASYSRTKNVLIQNLFLDGVSIFSRLSDTISVENNVFYNLASKFPVDLNASNDATINHNIFMRDATHSQPNDTYNRAVYIGGYSTQNRFEHMENTVANGNLFGLKLDELDAIKSFSPAETDKIIVNLQKAITEKKIEITGGNEQNYFSTGINSYSMLKQAEIKDNLFYQNYDNADMHGVSGDHAIYLRGSQDIQVVGNHLRGLHNGPAGGFKFKSGRNITIMNNYLRNTGIIMYGTPEFGYGDSYDQGTISELSGWLVANNTFDWKYWQEKYAIGIEYNKHTGDTNVTNGVFMDNQFVNYHNIPANRRRGLLIADGGGFRPDNTYVANNTRDDTTDKKLDVEYWSTEDYLKMPTDWKALVDASLYDRYKDAYVPVRNTLPIPINNQVILQGTTIDPLTLVAATHDQDEAAPTAKILNPEALKLVGKQSVHIQLDYKDGSIVEIQTEVQVDPLPIGQVTIHYQDEAGKKLAPTKVVTGAVGSSFQATPEIIEGYTLKTIPTNETGTYTDTPQTVTYIYERTMGASVHSYYKNATDGTELANSEIVTGYLGDAYTTTVKEIEGYDLTTTPPNQTGLFTTQEQSVIYLYTKKAPIIIDKQELLTEIAKVKLIDSALYTDESYNRLMTVLTQADAVANDPLATQDAVNQAVEDLLKAVESLVEKPAGQLDKVALVQAIDDGKMLNPKEYTVESFKQMTDALAIAEEINKNATASQMEIDSATAQLVTAIQNLVKIPALELQKLVDVIQQAKGIDGLLYTDESYANLKSILQLAENLIQDIANDPTSFIQADIDFMVNQLTLAIQDLIEKPIILPVNKDALTSHIQQAELLVAKDYTVDSFNMLLAELALAQQVRDDENATQEAVDEAEQKLRLAIQQLVVVEEVQLNFDALQQAIQQAEALDESLYTPESFARLQKELQIAKQFMLQFSRNIITQADIDQRTTSLIAAINQLDKIKETVEDPAEEKPDEELPIKEQPPKGDSAEEEIDDKGTTPLAKENELLNKPTGVAKKDPAGNETYLPKTGESDSMMFGAILGSLLLILNGSYYYIRRIKN